ncbi:MAG TPA: flagellar basal-body MS-ring/collar protein FliF, partial [Alphaproteobacteria bacterium]|nr:flagellar basal-body MS-ring/collar protein FliF [Alphaproteobacteria bacterium]
AVGFFYVLSSQLAAPNMALLYSNLDPEDSGEIAAKLDSMGVPYEFQGGGAQILVPADRALQLRMSLAEDGLPGTGSVGYEIFDRSDALGSNSLVQNVNLLRALEGELARTIRSITQVANARVHLVLPRREVFAREQPEASASVALKMRGSAHLSAGQVNAIQNLVAAAVPGLKPDYVTVVDDRGNLLARGNGDGETAAAGEDAQGAFEERLEGTIEELLERSVGFGKVRAQISVEMNFDRVTENTESYDPEGQVVRSTQTIEETSLGSDSSGDEAVTVANDLPDEREQPAPATESSSSQSTRTEEIVNYEITRTTTSHVRESGEVELLSVAVVVDGSYQTAEDGTVTYVPRTQDELAQYTALVNTAVGFDEQRGDRVEVVNLPFIDLAADVPEGEAPMLSFGKTDYLKILEILVLGFVAVLIIFMVLRPLAGRLTSASATPATDGSAGGTPQLPGPTAGRAQLSHNPSAARPEAQANEAQEEESMIDISRVEGRVRASTVRKIGEIVEKHPEEALSIVRTWLYEAP